MLVKPVEVQPVMQQPMVQQPMVQQPMQTAGVIQQEESMDQKPAMIEDEVINEGDP